jgi:hypothetical protein
MPFTGICSPEQLAVLTKAMDNYCAKHGIARPSHQREDVGYAVLTLFMKGAETAEELEAGLEAVLADDDRRRA